MRNPLGDTYAVTLRWRIWLMLSAGAALMLGALWLDPIAQDPSYHQFADQRTRLWQIGNTLNVLSNLPFALVGAWGFYRVRHAPAEHRRFWAVLFSGVLLVSAGSSYYHVSPDSERLVWDRLPMTVAFMALCALVVAVQFSVAHARRLLWLLLAAGIASVWYWHITEARGAGDLRPYGLVQFAPLVLLPLSLFLFESPPGFRRAILQLAALYGLSKVCEAADAQIYAWLGFVSGHSLKHIVAALGMVPLIRYIKSGQPRPIATGATQ